MCSESFRGSPSENLDLGTCADRSMKHPLSSTRAQLSSTENPTEERTYQVLCPRHGLHKETTWLLSSFTLVQNLCAGASAELAAAIGSHHRTVLRCCFCASFGCCTAKTARYFFDIGLMGAIRGQAARRNPALSPLLPCWRLGVEHAGLCKIRPDPRIRRLDLWECLRQYGTPSAVNTALLDVQNTVLGTFGCSEDVFRNFWRDVYFLDLLQPRNVWSCFEP